MSKIFIVMGKSATGKDTIFKRLVQNDRVKLKTIIPYTTRPVRTGESNGVEYFFVSEEEMRNMDRAGKIIEVRKYQTVLGDWYYFTADDGQIQMGSNAYLMITTLEAYEKIRDFYGKGQVVPVYIEVEDGERLTRALAREKRDKNPKFDELCRRYLADQKDFAEENLLRLGITRRYQNQDIEQCVDEILSDIEKML